jgi:predicted secreted protein
MRLIPVTTTEGKTRYLNVAMISCVYEGDRENAIIWLGVGGEDTCDVFKVRETVRQILAMVHAL